MCASNVVVGRVRARARDLKVMQLLFRVGTFFKVGLVLSYVAVDPRGNTLIEKLCVCGV